ncbi:MAG: hypothetical protein Q9187_007389, partial [Circinaria calcarea]
MGHQLLPPLNIRVFPELVISAKAGRFESIIVHIPIEIRKLPEAFYSNGRNFREGDSDLKRKTPVLCAYTSIERTRILPDENIEWTMAVTSDAKGSLPMWAQKMGLPGAIAKDVGLVMHSATSPSLPPRPPPEIPASNATTSNGSEPPLIPQGPPPLLASTGQSTGIDFAAKTQRMRDAFTKSTQAKPRKDNMEASSTTLYNPQKYGPMPGTQTISRGPVRMQPDTSKWGVKYNHDNTHNQEAQSKPPLPPRPSSANQGILDASPLSSSHVNQDDQDGYQLQPVAYNPNAKTEDNEDSRQSWRKGDDLESMQPGTSAQAPPKPPKIPKDHRSDIVQKTEVAPQLPPLYFESGSQTQQYDFAYDQQSNQHAHHQSIPRGQESLRLVPTIPKPSENKFPSSPLPQPPPRPSSHVKYDNQRAFAANSQQGFTLPIAVGTREQAPPYPDRPPPAPTLPRIASTAEAQQPVSNMPISDNGCLPLSTSPLKSDRPSMPRIATGNPEATAGNPSGLSGADSSTPEQVDHLSRESKEDGQGVHSSFYWHSPQSSTDTTLNRSPTAIDINETRDSALPVRTTTSVESGSGLYNASALGFGGPSDWEHFGDYNGEEIDDTDLYITAKPKVESDRSEGLGVLPGLPAAELTIAALPDTVELPAIKSPPQKAAARPLVVEKETPLDESRKQSVTEASEEPGSSEVSQPKQLNLDLTHEPDNISDSEGEEASEKVLRRDSTPAPIESGHSGSDQAISLLENRDLNEHSTAGVHLSKPEMSSLEPVEQLEILQFPTETVGNETALIQTPPEEDEGESNNEWEDHSSDADEQVHDTVLHMSQDEMKLDSVELGDQKDSKVDGDHEERDEVGKCIKINTARDNDKFDDGSQQHHEASEIISISSVHDDSKIADTPPELHEANEGINIKTVMSEDKLDECDAVTRREDDKAHEVEEDGGEDIIISLEMPALDEPAIPTTQPQDQRISESNETHLPQ